MLKDLSITVKVCVPGLIFLVASCSSPVVNTPKDLQEAAQTFKKTALEEYKYQTFLTTLENTLYIYVPIEGSILTYKVDTKTAADPMNGKNKQELKFIDAEFNNNTFHVTFDVVPTRAYPQSYGYASNYTDAFTGRQQAMMQLLQRVYFDLDEVAGQVKYADEQKNATYDKMIDQHVLKTKLPEFVVLIIADIETGLQYYQLMSMQDLKQTMSVSQSLPYEEFLKRSISRVEGNEHALGDATGQKVDYVNVTWPTFLSQQIKQRVTFKYQQSDFPPSENAEDEMLDAVKATVSAYDYKDFQAVRLTDLSVNETKRISRDEL